MNTKQHILLELGVENPVPVSNALHNVESTRPTTFGVLFNRKPLGVTLTECCDLLWELYQQELIAFYHYRRDPFRISSSALELARKELLAALRARHEVRRDVQTDLSYYQLTPTGGATWEELAGADWDRFLSHEESDGDTWDDVFGVGAGIPESTALEQQNRLQVRMRSRTRKMVEDRYKLDASTLGIVVPDSRVDRDLAGWEATYWKTLSAGYQIGYSIYSQAEMRTNSMMRSDHTLADDPRRNTPKWYGEAQ